MDPHNFWEGVKENIAGVGQKNQCDPLKLD
jgi:hypothetical protein